MKTAEYKKCDQILKDFLSNFNYITTHRKTNESIIRDYLVAKRSIITMTRVERTIFTETYINGLTISEIAQKLSLTDRGVQYHKKQLIDKTIRELNRESKK